MIERLRLFISRAAYVAVKGILPEIEAHRRQTLGATADLARLIVDSHNGVLSHKSKAFLMRMNIDPKSFQSK